MSNGCEYCEGRAYTKKPLTVITKYGRKIELVFEFCPNCGRKMKRDNIVRRVERQPTTDYRKATDVAKEIFEEIDKLIGKRGDLLMLSNGYYLKLKKKYAESEENND